MKKLFCQSILLSLIFLNSSIIIAQNQNGDVECVEDCVYPGNTTATHQQLPTNIPNTDEVNVEDVLLIGLHYGEVGPIRSDMGIDFNPKAATDWAANAVSPYEAVDLKHVDCNGDGIIDVADLQAIAENYGKTLTATDCNDTSWMNDIINGTSQWSSPECYSALVQYDFNGSPIYYLNSLCSDTDVPAIFFDCNGNPVCYTNGFASPYCSPNFVEQLTFVRSVWQNADCVCSTMHASVCGRNGQTYSSECEANCLGILIDPQGTCGGCSCPEIYDPVCGADGVTYGNSCFAECAHVNWTSGACEGCDCPDIYEPVCGADGVTYGNSCEADCENMPWTPGVCHAGDCTFSDTGIAAPEYCHKVERFLYQGHTVFVIAPCEGAQIADGLTEVYDCEGGIICRENGFAGFTQCSDINFWQQATIQDIEVSCFDNCDQCHCPEYYAPVCAEDGETYANPCFAECAGVIGTAGACDNCVCTEIYDPVCGANGVTYSNSCYADCANVSWTPGPCGDGQSPIQHINIDPNPASACEEDTAILLVHTHWPSAECMAQHITIDYSNTQTSIEATFEPGPMDVPCDSETLVPLVGLPAGQHTVIFTAIDGLTGEGWREAITFTVQDCIDNCPCPDVLDPVCGSDGQTYDNSCIAECVGVNWTAGACTIQEPSPIHVVDVHPNSACSDNTTTAFIHTHWSSAECLATNTTLSISDNNIAVSADYELGPMDVPCDDFIDINLGHLAAGPYYFTFHANDVTTGQSWEATVAFTVEPCSTNCDCPTVYDPVCGANGQTYSNSCYADCDSVSWTAGTCNSGDCSFADTGASTPECHKVERYTYQGQTVFAVSPCQGSNLSDGLTIVYDCEGNTICQEGGFAGFTECSDADFWNQATFEELVISCAHDCPNCGCDDFYDPVCGSDGQTYSNSCQAECAGVTWTTGECNGAHLNCVCPLAFVPVCGPDTTTYDNSCMAECAGLNEWTNGSCNNSNGHYYNNIDELTVSSHRSCDPITLTALTRWLSGDCMPTSHNVQRAGENIFVQVNYNIGAATFICDNTFTVDLGLLPPNIYKVYFNATNEVTGKTSTKLLQVPIYRCSDADCSCPNADNPVCGDNGVNYACETEAMCHGVDEWISGFCDCTYPYSGTVVDASNLDGCGFLIRLDNHITLQSIPDNFNIYDGQRVRLNYEPVNGLANTCMAGYIAQILCIEEIPQKGETDPEEPIGPPDNIQANPAQVTANLKAQLVGEEVLPDGNILYNFDLLLEGNGNGDMVEDVYGLAFSIHYTSDLPTVAEAKFNDAQGQSYSWLGDAQSIDPATRLLTLDKIFTHETGGQIDIALTRINHQSASGTGRICQISCVTTIDNWALAGDAATDELADPVETSSSIVLSNVRLVDENNNVIPATGEESNINLSIIPPSLLQVKAFLEGAFSTDLNPNQPLQNNLSVNNLLSIQQPYYTAPWNYESPIATADAVTAEGFGQIPTDMVDWVLVEVRAADNPAQIVAQKVALLRQDGQVMDVASLENNLGYTGVLFYNLAQGTDYYIVLRHRNHLDVMSATPATWSGNALTHDFTTTATQALGTGQLKEMAPNQFALRAGDFDGNGIISVSDFNQYAQQISNSNSYQTGDVDFDGNVLVQDFNIYQPNASAIGVHWIRY